jgi:hypothetical protein
MLESIKWKRKNDDRSVPKLMRWGDKWLCGVSGNTGLGCNESNKVVGKASHHFCQPEEDHEYCNNGDT